jgi:hypothetical protein
MAGAAWCRPQGGARGNARLGTKPQPFGRQRWLVRGLGQAVHKKLRERLRCKQSCGQRVVCVAGPGAIGWRGLESNKDSAASTARPAPTARAMHLPICAGAVHHPAVQAPVAALDAHRAAWYTAVASCQSQKRATPAPAPPGNAEEAATRAFLLAAVGRSLGQSHSTRWEPPLSAFAAAVYTVWRGRCAVGRGPLRLLGASLLRAERGGRLSGDVGVRPL